MKFFQNLSSRLSIFAELWAFMRVRKKWWLGPIIIVLVFLSLVIVLTDHLFALLVLADTHSRQLRQVANNNILDAIDANVKAPTCLTVYCIG
ncbi:MAG: hypothetical protein E6K56_08950 [Ignavibacteria bacterium]|nr:MAG: hypothetical protein E6K56_08950 [Ignavibacteria bacterium]